MIRNDIMTPEIFFESVGDWAGVERKISRLAKNLQSSATYGQRKAAQKLVKIVKGHIDNQDLGWEPLKHPTLSGDARVLVDYGTYRDNIKTWQEGGKRFVGVKKSVLNNRGEYVWKVAAMHEYKSSNGGPYRALWEPSINEMGGAQGVREIVGRTIRNRLMKL